MPHTSATPSTPEVPAFAAPIILLGVVPALLPVALGIWNGESVPYQITRMLGLASLSLWALSLVLMLRLQALEAAAGGLDRLYFLHHLCGGVAYLAMLAHPIPLFFSSSAGALLNISHWPMTAGWISLLLLMAMMLATFLLPLRYARWKQVHAISAPAFILAGAHAIALAPGRFSFDRLFAGAALLVGCSCLAIRYLMEAGRVRSLPYRVEHVSHPSAEVTEMVLSPDNLTVRPKPGQFIFAAFFDGRNFHGCGEFHPFTVVSSDPGSGRFTLLVKALGDCTRRLTHVEPGTRARVEGPYGSFLATIDAARPQLWIAGGIGITPFISAAAARPPAGEGVDLFYLAGSRSEAIGLPQLQALAGRNPRLRVHCLPGERDIETIWRKIAAQVPDAAGRQVFMCGPPALVDGLRVVLTQTGVPQADIHSERFDFR